MIFILTTLFIIVKLVIFAGVCIAISEVEFSIMKESPTSKPGGSQFSGEVNLNYNH